MTRQLLRRTQFGNPLLRSRATKLSAKEIRSTKTSKLIADMRHTLKTKKYGVGLAAPQIGQGIAMFIIEIKPTKMRPLIPKEKWASLVFINPVVVKAYGNRNQLWEGCISFGEVFAKVPRYKKIRAKYIDENGSTHQKTFDGLLAHILQHEIDHLNGVLFVDKVKDPKTFITAAEYKKLTPLAEENEEKKPSSKKAKEQLVYTKKRIVRTGKH